MSFQLLLGLYALGTFAAVWVARARGYWWPIAIGMGLLLGPLAPAVLLVLPNRHKARS